MAKPKVGIIEVLFQNNGGSGTGKYIPNYFKIEKPYYSLSRLKIVCMPKWVNQQHIIVVNYAIFFN